MLTAMTCVGLLVLERVKSKILPIIFKLETYLNIHGTEVASVGNTSITPTRQDAIDYMINNLSDLIRDIPTLNYNWNPRNGSARILSTQTRVVMLCLITVII